MCWGGPDGPSYLDNGLTLIHSSDRKVRLDPQIFIFNTLITFILHLKDETIEYLYLLITFTNFKRAFAGGPDGPSLLENGLTLIHSPVGGIHTKPRDSFFLLEI